MPFKGTEDRRLVFSFESNDIKRQIDRDDEILQRFREFLFASLRKNSTAPQYFLQPPHNRIAEIIRDSMETFIFGHEFSHILFNHRRGGTLMSAQIGEVAFKKLVHLWQNEFDADCWGLLLMLGTMRNKGYSFSLGYLGAELFFSFQNIFERGMCLLNSGTEDWFWCDGRENGPLCDHPPAMIRRQKLRELVKNQFGEESLEPSKAVENMIKILWDKTKDILNH
jgi:hypothetical protein